jgi:hypothetical protein
MLSREQWHDLDGKALVVRVGSLDPFSGNMVRVELAI